MRVVVDTNLWVSYLLQPHSPLAPRLDDLTRRHTLLYSHETIKELASVLMGPKFSRYISADDIRTFVTALIGQGEEILVTSVIQACRDPRDDMFLRLAVDGRADYIVSGHADLLVLHPFRAISIVQLADFPDSQGCV